MQVSVAIVPPEGVSDEISALLEAVPGAARELELVPAHLMRLPVMGLGNLTRPDTSTVCNVLARKLVERDTAPRVRLAGVWALEDGDPGIALHLEGDVDTAVGLAKGLPQMVEDLGLYVDRRLFAPRMVVARVTDATTLPVLEALVAALERYRSPTWTIATVEVHQVIGGTRLEVVASLPTTAE
ncbi:hypothetical protein JQN72_04560 [Phycicoccus sp. CSK15P-2]|uniref:2'-5' RNA ligase family protein n=1 Tax=Phycicoccus sp. CSK15P-2 TaxID=2807627 RepID=UPI0019506FC2|nr:hypothetical protein [Phycicoccus sp. CSK15P-2]MBM6403514.1 hypothetical protein [Phycicoccus sp. CSK15P-2]